MRSSPSPPRHRLGAGRCENEKGYTSARVCVAFGPVNDRRRFLFYFRWVMIYVLHVAVAFCHTVAYLLFVTTDHRRQHLRRVRIPIVFGVTRLNNAARFYMLSPLRRRMYYNTFRYCAVSWRKSTFTVVVVGECYCARVRIVHVCLTTRDSPSRVPIIRGDAGVSNVQTTYTSFENLCFSYILFRLCTHLQFSYTFVRSPLHSRRIFWLDTLILLIICQYDKFIIKQLLI